MLLRFKIDDQEFRCLNSEIASTATAINYIKCHFDVHGTGWEDVDAICAIFKSATYNQHYEVMLDSNNNCLIDPEIYRRGGTIQVKLVGDKYIDGSVVSSTSITPVIEFQIRDNVIIPTPTPSKYDVFIAEIEIARVAVEAAVLDLAQRVASGEFDGKDGANITNIVYNSDSTVTISLSDGQEFTSVQSMKGEKGDKGDNGVGIVSVAYGEDGTLVITMNDGTVYESEYSMKGERGEQGEKGEAFVYEDFTQEELDDLATAATPNFQIGTVSTLEPGSQVTATITGEPRNPILNLGIPRGEKGETGDVNNIDTAMSSTSSLPVQNKAIKSYVDSGLSSKANSTDIPTKVSDLTNDSGFINGNAGGVFYGTCATAAATTAKVVECEEFTSVDLVAGTIISVKFSATNSGAVANLTLNVNGTGAKNIKYNNNGTLGNLSSAGYLKADTTYLFVYDGTYWVAMFNCNTTYSAMSEAEAKAGTATSARTITPQRLKQAIECFADALPAVTISDEGKFLRVNSSGTWAAETVPSAESEAY